jgi:hypothetical protein
VVLGAILTLSEPSWGPYWSHIELYGGCLGAILGSYWGHLGIILAILGHIRVILGNLGAISGRSWPSWAMLGSPWLSWAAILEPFWDHVGAILGLVWVKLKSTWVVRPDA